MSGGPLCFLRVLEILVCTHGGAYIKCVHVFKRGCAWHLTYQNVTTQVIARAYDQILIQFY